MEHRWGKRWPVALEVVLKCRDNSTLLGRMQNISRDGMFVSLKRCSLREGFSVDVEFILEDKTARRLCCLEAMVVHRSDAGLGLMFHTTETGDCLALKRFLSGGTD